MKKIYDIEKKAHKENLVYKTDNCTYSFQQFETVRYFSNVFYMTKVL